MTNLAPICGTCGSAFTCFNGTPPVASAWYDCIQVCAMCSGSLEDGRAVMEHPGLGCVIHLACCPVPADDDVLAQGLKTAGTQTAPTGQPIVAALSAERARRRHPG